MRSNRTNQADGHHYRIVVDGMSTSGLADAFPELAVHHGSSGTATVLEGPVADQTQLAGIVSLVCHRNGRVIRVEIVDEAEWPLPSR